MRLFQNKGLCEIAATTSLVLHWIKPDSGGRLDRLFVIPMSVCLVILLGLLPVFELFETQLRELVGDSVYVGTYRILGTLLAFSFCLVFVVLGGYKLFERGSRGQ